MVERIATSALIAKYRAIYMTIRPINSSAIEDMVYFNIRGFKHLIFKGGHRRTTSTIYSRLVLIPLILPVISNCTEVVETRIRREWIDGKKVVVTYHALEARVGKDSVRARVVTRKVGDAGKNYFQSIMKY